MQPNCSSRCSSGRGYQPRQVTGFSALEASTPVALIVHSLTPNSFYLGEDRTGCAFLFSLGLFTDFIGSDYGALLYRLKPAPLKTVTTGKEGEGAEGSSEELNSNLVPWLCSSRYIDWLFPYTTGAVSLELTPWHCTGYREGRKAAESLVHNRQRSWLNIQVGELGY